MNDLPNKPKCIIPLNVKTSLAGYFKIILIKKDGSREKVADWTPNLITTQGLNYFGSAAKDYASHLNGKSWVSACHVGIGSTAPSFNDVALDNFLAETRFDTEGGYPITQATVLPYYRGYVFKYTFAQGAVIGNITELGLGKLTAYGGISTRALILDTNDDPTSIPVTADDQLEISYQLRAYTPDLSTVDDTMIIDGSLYNTKTLLADINTTFGSFIMYPGSGFVGVNIYLGTSLPNISVEVPPYFGLPTLASSSLTSTEQAYVNDTFYQDSVAVASISEGYTGTKGITAIVVSGYMHWWQISFTQDLADYGIPHDNTNEIVFTARHTWARYTPP